MISFVRNPRALFVAIAAACIAPVASAAVSYTTSGSTYTQDFNSLPPGASGTTNVNLQGLATPMEWQDDTNANTSSSPQIISLPGWYLYHPTVQASEGGTNTHQRLRIGSGNSATGSFYDFGTNNNTDRALGDLGSATLADDTVAGAGTVNSYLYVGLRLTNNTGATLNSITIGYTGEQWRDAGNGATDADQLNLAYSVGATSIIDSNATFTNVPSLTFLSPVHSTTAATLDGNAAANRTVFAPITLSIPDWAPGTDLWLRWADPQLPTPTGGSGSTPDDGLAIDDVSFSASAAAPVPEPASLALLSLPVFALASRRRRA